MRRSAAAASWGLSIFLLYYSWAYVSGYMPFMSSAGLHVLCSLNSCLLACLLAIHCEPKKTWQQLWKILMDFNNFYISGNKNEWPLKVVTYIFWSLIQQRVYETRVHDIDELRHCLLHVWHGLEQSLIDDAVDQWCVLVFVPMTDILNITCVNLLSVCLTNCFKPRLMQRFIF